MGDLNVVQSTPSLPAWALQNSMDLSKWNWEPPTRLPARDEKPERTLPAWLREWTPTDLEEQALQPTRSRNTTFVQAPSILAELDSFRVSILAVSPDAVAPEYRELCKRLEKQISLGQVASDELDNALQALFEALDARSGNVPDTSVLSIALCSAVVNGIKTSRVLVPSDFGSSFWGKLLAQMAKLPANDDLCKLFELAMDTLPTGYHGKLSNGVLSVLDTFYTSWSGTDYWDSSLVARSLQTATEANDRFQAILAEAMDSAANNTELAKSLLQRANEVHQTCRDAIYSATNAISSHQRQVQAVSRALSGMDPKRRLFAAANQRLSNRPLLSPEACHQLRYNWLSVLSQLPRISQDALLEAHKILCSEPTVHPFLLTNTEICRLLISHWASRGRLTSPQRFEHLVERLCAGHDSAGFAALTYALSLEEKDRRWLIDGLCKFLKQVGRLAELPSSFEKLGELERLPVRLLERLATAADDHKVAIGLHDAYVSSQSGPGGSDWNPRTWWKYLDAMLMDPAVSPARLWKILGIEFYEDMGRKHEPRRTKQRCSYGEESAAIVASLAVRFAYAAHLGNRVAYRHVSQCVVFLEKYTKNVPPSVLQALYHVVSRDLAEGRPARTARLQWFLRIVERQCGGQMAGECGLLLQQWRHLALRMRETAALR